MDCVQNFDTPLNEKYFRVQFYLNPPLTQTKFRTWKRVRSGMGTYSEQRVAASTLRRYFFGLRLAIAQADARPVMPMSLK